MYCIASIIEKKFQQSKDKESVKVVIDFHYKEPTVNNQAYA